MPVAIAFVLMLALAAAAHAAPKTLLEKRDGEAEVTVVTDTALAAEPAFQKLVDGAALKNARAFLKAHRRDKLQFEGLRNGYTSAATVDFAGRDLLSVLRTVSEFTGGAHPNSGFVTGIWDRRANRSLGVGDIVAGFRDGSPAMIVVAEHVRAELARALGADTPQDMLNDGTAPKAENYSLATLAAPTQGDKPAGLIFYFPPYAVASYAQGAQAVIVSADLLRPYLTPAFRDAFGGTPKPLPPRD